MATKFESTNYVRMANCNIHKVIQCKKNCLKRLFSILDMTRIRNGFPSILTPLTHAIKLLGTV